MVNLTSEQIAHAARLCKAHQKIPAIKFVREVLNCGLREAKDWVDNHINNDPAFQPTPGEFHISISGNNVYAQRQNLQAGTTASPNQRFDIIVGAVIAALRVQLSIYRVTSRWGVGWSAGGRKLGTLKIKNIKQWTTRATITYVEGATRYQVGLKENPKSLHHPKYFAHFSDRFERLARELILIGDAELTLHTLMR